MTKMCTSCSGKYTTMQGNFTYVHACAPVKNKLTGKIEERADKRDENIVETITVEEHSKLSEEQQHTVRRIRVKSEGKGVQNI